MNFCSLYKDRLRPSRMIFLMAALFLLLNIAAFGAEYQGQNVDGIRYPGYVRSLTTGKYYPASLVFETKYVDVQFASGKRLHLILDEQSIEDPEEVVAADPQGRWWGLSIDGLDGPPPATETPMVASARRKSR